MVIFDSTKDILRSKISEMSLHSQTIEPKIDIKYFFDLKQNVLFQFVIVFLTSVLK